MALYPPPFQNRWASFGLSAATSTGTTVTSGSSGVKGSWVQLIASTSRTASGMRLNFCVENDSSASRLIDIGFGAAASEVVKLSNLMVDPWGTGGGYTIDIPYPVPAGTRIAARVQASASTIDTTVSGNLFWGPSVTTPLITTLGAVSATSTGTPVDPGGTINTKGAWVQLSSGITTPTAWAALIVGSNNNSGPNIASWLFDVGIGTAGSEQVIWSDLEFRYPRSVAGGNCTPNLHANWLAIPAGTPVSVRCQCNINNATDRVLAAELLVGAPGMAV